MNAEALVDELVIYMWKGQMHQSGKYKCVGMFKRMKKIGILGKRWYYI